MNYYYDVTLNFDLENVWEFYEWEKDDVLTFVKKIPLFRVSFETISDFLRYHIQMNSDFVKEIAYKTTVSDSKEQIYAAFLMSDTKNTLAVLLNEEGEVISLSKTLITDDNNINEFMYTLREKSLSYCKKGLRNTRNGLRQEEKLKHLILVELQTLMQEENVQKLKYLYYEWFGKEEEDKDKMYHEMMLALQNPMNDDLERIHYFIRLSYHQV